MANVVPTSYTLSVGNVSSGMLDDAYTQNGVDFVIDEVTGTPGMYIEFDFLVADTATDFKIYGYYGGNAGHTVNIDAWNGSGWDNLGTWPEDTGDALSSWSLNAGNTINNMVRVRVDHVSAGNPNHDFFFDHIYVVADPYDRMALSDGVDTVYLSPLVDRYNQPDARVRGYNQYDSGIRQYWDFGAGEKHELSVNDVAHSIAGILNNWWQSLTILTVTPDNNVPASTYYARINPAGQRPMQMMFDTGYQNRYEGTITLHEVSSSSSG